MKVQVTRQFQWAPDGNHVREVKPGEVLEGRGAAVALELKAGAVVELASPALAATAPPGSNAAPPVRRLPPVGEYVAAGYSEATYAQFIVDEAARAGAEGLGVAIRAPTEAEVAELEGLKKLTAALGRQVDESVEKLGKAAESAASAVINHPATDPMPTPDQLAQAELERQPQEQGPKAPAVAELPSRKELEKLTQHELLALALSRGLTVEADTGKGKLLKLLTAQ